MQLLFSIGVCGSRSSTGKTTFIEKFIRYIKKQCESKLKIIAIKYTKTSLYSSIISEPSIIEEIGKDTERMKKAGADFVYWVRAHEDNLVMIVERLKEEIIRLIQNDDRTVQNNTRRTILIIEGNSMVRIMRPDVIIFFKDFKNEHLKPSANSVIEIADLSIEGKYSMEEVMAKIKKIHQNNQIYQLLKERSNNGKITCVEARKIAEELSVPYIEVGKAANELNIKIYKCELGCF